jgi:hypothetical protein
MGLDIITPKQKLAPITYIPMSKLVKNKDAIVWS